jgi:DNA polymerase III subunit epsilon
VMLSAFKPQGATAAILGAGRSPEEQSVILVEQGIYAGFGFVSRGITLEDPASVRQWIVEGKDNRVAQSLVTAVLQNPEDREIVYFP